MAEDEVLADNLMKRAFVEEGLEHNYNARLMRAAAEAILSAPPSNPGDERRKAMEADTKRLDWLTENNIACGPLFRSYEDGQDVVPPRHLGWWTGHMSDPLSPTLREAIDRALSHREDS